MDFRDKFQYKVNSKLLAAIVLAILLVVNFLAQYFFVRFDWTENDRYSISDSTVEILHELDDLVSVKAYFTSDLPPQFLGVQQYVNDILSEYKAYGGGNFTYEFLDPSTDQSLASEAANKGIQQVRMQVRQNDSIQVKDGYMGLGIFYAGKTEVIPVIQQESLGSLEYDLTSLIVKMTRDDKPVLAFLQGHDEQPLSAAAEQGSRRGYSTLNQALQRNYTTRTVNFADGGTLDDVDVLVVPGPRRDLSDRDIFEIDQFLLAGGDAIFLIDVLENLQGGTNVSPVTANVAELFNPWGISLPPNLVLDQLSAMANFSEGPGQFYFLPYPPFIQLVPENFSSSPIVAKMPGFVVRFVSELILDEPVDGINYDPFIKTSAQAWTQTEGSFQLNPRSIPTPSPADQGRKTLGMMLRGQLPRLSESDTVPPLERVVPGEEEGTWSRERVTPDPNRSNREVLTESQAESEVLILTDSDFLADAYVANDQTSLVLFLNMADYLTYGEQLISIRTKSLAGAHIRGDLTASDRTLMRFIGIALVPVLLSTYGFVRLWMRRKEEKVLDL